MTETISYKFEENVQKVVDIIKFVQNIENEKLLVDKKQTAPSNDLTLLKI